MSTPATIPVFDPQGVLRDVPQDQLKAAVDAGGKPSVRFQAPDGKIRYVPANMTADAVKAGGKLLPIEQQDVQQPGLWHAIASDALGFGKSILNAGPEMATGDQMHEDAAYQQKLINEGHSAPYRALMSLTPNGMRESAESGDVGGVAGHTVVPVATAASPLMGPREVAPAMGGLPKAVDNAINHPITKAVSKTVDVATFDRIGKIWNAWKNLPEEIRARGPQFADPGAPLPEHPPTELLQARGLGEGGKAGVDTSAGLGKVPVRPVYPGAPLPATPPAEVLNPSIVSPARTLPGQISPESIRPPAQPIPKRYGLALTGDVEPAPAPEAPAIPSPMSKTPSGETIPRTFSGESALRQVLTGQDNVNLLKIAKSRGINVAKEVQLKPGIADGLLISKIIDDFSPEQLSEVRNQYLENTRFHHTFGDIGPEAWKTMSLQTYFPELKLTQAQLKRTATAVQKDAAKAEPATTEDLTSELERSVAHVKAKKQAAQ